MPSQLFTLARKFQAASNGKIYIGKIDTDPTIPENQIQVYLENEDGSTIPVAQPLSINQAGYPVYNGQIARFVTVEGHSMAVYDSYGSLEFNYPNVLKYDPDQFSVWAKYNFALTKDLAGTCIIPDYAFPDLNDSDAIEESIKTGNVVKLLPRKYIISKPIELKNSCQLIGSGKTKTIIECITSTAGFYNDYGFNIQLKGFQLNGGNVANKGIILGSQSGISAHHVLDDIQVYDFKEANIHIIKGIYHHLTDGVYVTGGVGYGLLTESMDVSIIEGRHYNHAKGSVVITNSSNFNTFKGKVYNDISFPSDYLMIVDSSCGNNIGFDFEPQGENNVKASLIIDNVTGVPWKKSNMSDNSISGNFLGLSKTSLESHIVIGGNSAAYKTIIDKCKFLTLYNDLPDIKLVKQNDTKIINCINNLTYDTPILKDAVVMNVGGDSYIHVKFKDEAVGSFNPIVKTTGVQPTITSTGDSAGYYQRIGNRCFVDLWVTISTTNNGTGAVQIHGLPFKQKSAGQRRASLCVSIHTVSDSGGYVAEGENYIDLIKGSGALVSTDLGSSFRFRASFSYLV